MTSSLPILAARLTFGYYEPEDRLTLLTADARRSGVHVALTRRLTDRLINGLAHLLEQSSVVASTAPADLRDDIILMEHQDALFGHGERPLSDAPGATGSVPSLPAPRLVTAVDVRITPKSFELLLRDAQSPLIRLSLNRLEVHRIVEGLSQRAEAAGRNIAVEAAWLELGQTEIVFN